MLPMTEPLGFSSAARWIYDAGDIPRNDWRYFRKTWDAPAAVTRVTLLLTADSRYEAHLNGAFLGRGPARGFPYAYNYDSYDLTPTIRAGAANTLALLVNFLGDHTMGTIEGRAGLLAEIVVEAGDGSVTRVATDTSWRTAKCEAFNANAPRISVQLGFEEQLNAVAELPDWESPTLDDSGWAQAVELGPVGVAPWTQLLPRTIPPLTEDYASPVAIKAVELARVRHGAFWSLDLRHLLGTMRNGLRSAPPGERGSILCTEIVAPRDCVIKLHRFPNYEPIVIRVNDRVYGETSDALANSEAPVDIPLKQGPNLVMLRTVEWPSMLFETDEPLTFTAERFALSSSWAVIPMLNELNGELQQWWQAPSFDAWPRTDRIIGIHASANKLDIFAQTSSQQFFAVPGGFCTYDITRATPRALLEGSGATPVERPNALLHDNDDWTTIQPTDGGDVHIVVDFGRETIGYVEIELDAPNGAIIDGNFFEGIDDGGIFWMRNLRNTFRYVCREGHQVFRSHERRGFRYGSFTFRNLSRPLKIRHITHRVATYPVEARGSFHSSDETLNKIWEVGAYTVQLCMLDTYVDCPGYEQVYWVGDARNSALVNAVAFGAFDLTDHCIRLTGQSLADALTMVVPPHLTRPRLTASHVVSGWFDEIPMWTFLWVWMAWEQYLNVGDRVALTDYYADVEECLRRCEGFLSERDLLDIPDVWNLVDWAAQDLERDGEVIANTVFMAQALDCAALMADALGQLGKSAAHTELAQRLREAVNRYGWSEAAQGYVDTVRDQTAYERHQRRAAQRGVTADTWEVFARKNRVSEPTNTLALLCQAVPPERHDAVMKFVTAAKAGQFIGSSPERARFNEPDEVVPVGSPWFLFFTLETLFHEGQADDALKILREQWNKMLEKGATTFWETFPGLIGPGHWSRSLCHGWSAAPSYFLTTQVLGVTPAAPGYAKVRIAPRPFYLTWASGVVPTPHGDVSVAWRLDDDGAMVVEYHAPDGCEVELVLP